MDYQIGTITQNFVKDVYLENKQEQYFKIRHNIMQRDLSNWYTPTFVTQPHQILLLRKYILLLSLTIIQKGLESSF